MTGLERQKIEDEYRALIERIAELKAILDSRALVLQIINTELQEIRDKYGDDRRTEIVEDEGEIDIEDLIADEDMVVTISNQGYAKRIPLDTYRQQGRGGKGIAGMATKEEDFVDNLFVASAHQYLLVLTEKGTLHWLKVHAIPKAGRTSRGKPIVNLIQIMPGDHVHAVLPVREFREDHFLAMVTNLGVIKRTPLTDFSRVRKAGIRAINLLEGERLVAVRETDGSSEIILAATSGLAIRFAENDVRAMGRTARGVKGIALGKDQECVGMVVVPRNGGGEAEAVAEEPAVATADVPVTEGMPVEATAHGAAAQDQDLFAITENGYGKRTPLADYRTQGRGGKGLITIRCTERNGPLLAIRNVWESDELMVITRGGVIIRIAVEGVSQQGRNTQGVRIINLGSGDRVANIAKVEAEED